MVQAFPTGFVQVVELESLPVARWVAFGKSTSWERCS
jgi:hypothetical protein